MNNKQIITKLREILNKEDTNCDNIINRKKSNNNSEIEVLLQHISLLITDLKFNSDVSRRELFSIRNLLEE